MDRLSTVADAAAAWPAWLSIGAAKEGLRASCDADYNATHAVVKRRVASGPKSCCAAHASAQK